MALASRLRLGWPWCLMTLPQLAHHIFEVCAHWVCFCRHRSCTGTLVNDKALVAPINPSLEELMGNGKVIDHFPAVMGYEDFQEASSR
jgi:hypothetical protein